MVGGGWHGLLESKRIEKISMWKLEAVRPRAGYQNLSKVGRGGAQMPNKAPWGEERGYEQQHYMGYQNQRR